MVGSVGRIPSPAHGRAPWESQEIPEYPELEGTHQVRSPRAVVTRSLLAGCKTGGKPLPPSKAGMEEALLGWILEGLGFQSSTGFSGDVFALCRGCSWSHPGVERGSVSWHLEILQELLFPLLSLHSPSPFPFLVSCLATLVAFLEPSCQAVHTL